MGTARSRLERALGRRRNEGAPRAPGSADVEWRWEGEMRTMAALAFALWAQLAGAANIYVMSLTPSSAQIIVDGRTLRTLRLGEMSPEGVKLTEIRGSEAVFEVGGRSVALSLGQ